MKPLSPRKRKVEIVSDGTPFGTIIYVDGKILDGITKVTWEISTHNYATATIEVAGSEIDFEITHNEELKDEQESI
jgi:hypothetical protein